MSPRNEDENYFVSFFHICWDFIKEIFYAIINFFVSIWSLISSKEQESEKDPKAEIVQNPKDKNKRQRSEVRDSQIKAHFKSKNNIAHVKKANNIYASPQKISNYRPSHFDRGSEQNLNTRDIKGSRSNNNQQPRISHNHNLHHVERSNKYNNQDSLHHHNMSQDDIKRQKIGQETMQVVQAGKYKVYDKEKRKTVEYKIKDDVEWCINNTRTIRPNDQLLIGEIDKRSRLCKIDVTTESTFKALHRIITEGIEEVCILNFASATQPGGGFLNGRNAQEETLSRQSALYSSLKSESEMYDYHKANNNPFYSNYMIYSPNVPFFRDDNYNFIYPFTSSVITSPAVNYSELLKSGKSEKDIYPKVYKAMKKRCRRIIQLCIKEGNKAIVLGAFGCGVFKNPPEMISKIFKEILIDEGLGKHLQYVVFPIYAKSGTSGNTYKVFHDTLQT